MSYSIIVSYKLRISYTERMKYPDGFLGCTRSTASRFRDVAFSPCSALVSPEKYCVQFWAFQYKEGLDIVEKYRKGPQR